MIWFAILILMSSIISIFFGNYVYNKDSKNLLNRIFLFLCLSVALWGITEYGRLQANSFEIAYLWIKFGSIGYFYLAFGSIGYFHFQMEKS